MWVQLCQRRWCTSMSKASHPPHDLLMGFVIFRCFFLFWSFSCLSHVSSFFWDTATRISKKKILVFQRELLRDTSLERKRSSYLLILFLPWLNKEIYSAPLLFQKSDSRAREMCECCIIAPSDILQFSSFHVCIFFSHDACIFFSHVLLIFFVLFLFWLQVTMADREAAERAVKDANPIIDGRKANVNLAYLGAKPRNNNTCNGE